jgi:hypothetical protein
MISSDKCSIIEMEALDIGRRALASYKKHMMTTLLLLKGCGSVCKNIMG